MPGANMTSQTSAACCSEPPGTLPGEARAPAQCSPLPNLHAKDVGRRRQKKRSRQHQRFMARKALLQEQGLLGTAPGPGASPLPDPSPAPGRSQHPKSGTGSRRPAGRQAPGPGKCVAIDCEMVGTGPRGRVSELARCSVVSYHGDVLYDKYVRPEMPITDYRTRWSGITRQHMHKAIPFRTAQKEIVKLLKGKVVVGHALHNDFQALKYVHPRSHTRDTTRVPSLLDQSRVPTRAHVSLKDLALHLLNKKIQVGRHGHSSVEDAATAMELYRLVEVRWEEQEADSARAAPDDGGPDSSTELERFMEDQYWPADLAQGARGSSGDTQGPAV
ncbi:apoptosis-enhancing nuclease-like [Thomomys bottae]